MKDALNKIRKNIEANRYKLGETEKLIMNGVEIPDVGNFDIKIDVFSESRSKVSQGMTEIAKNKTRIIQLFREFERLVKQQDGFTDVEVERILEGFITNMAETKLCIKTQRSMEFFGMAFEFQRLQ